MTRFVRFPIDTTYGLCRYERVNNLRGRDMTPDQIKAVREIASVFIEAVKAGGTLGAPAGVMYAAVMDKLTLNQFQSIMATLVRAGKVRQSGNLYHYIADL